MRAVVLTAILSALLIILAILTDSALADADADDERVGRAPLFLLSARFNVSAYLDTVPQRAHAIAVLWDVPRRRRGHLRRVLRHTRASTVEVILLNETCVRNRVCEKRDALYGFTETMLSAQVAGSNRLIRSIVKRQAVQALRYVRPVLRKKHNLIINPFLETRLRPAEWNRAAGWLRREIGRVPLVWNPVNNSHATRPTRATYTEHHGLTVQCASDGRTIANLDGSRSSARGMRDWLRQTRQCRFALLWEPADNCRSSLEVKFIPPTQRFCVGNTKTIQEALK